MISDEDELKKRKHLRRLSMIYLPEGAAVFYITICTYKRKPILIIPPLSTEIIRTFEDAERNSGWSVGRYVIMPDHAHFFCAPRRNETDLSGFVGGIKSWTTGRASELGFGKNIWQREFFDHLLRNVESYEAKWKYVMCNPVRKGLCGNPEEWKYQGECSRLMM